MNQAEQIREQMQRPLHYERIAVREGPYAPWKWYHDPLPFTLENHGLARIILETWAVLAVERYGVQNCKRVGCETERGFDLADMSPDYRIDDYQI